MVHYATAMKSKLMHKVLHLAIKLNGLKKVGFGLVCAHIHGCISDCEYDKIIRRFQQKILLKYMEPMEAAEEVKAINGGNKEVKRRRRK